MLGQLHGRKADDSETGGGDRIRNSSYSDGGAALRYFNATRAGILRIGLAADEGKDIGKPDNDSAKSRAFYPLERSSRFDLSLETSPGRLFDNLSLKVFAGQYRLILHRERFLRSPSVDTRVDSSDVDSNDASFRVVGTKVLGRSRFQAGSELTSRFNLRAITGVRDLDSSGAIISDRVVLTIDSASRLDSGTFVTADFQLARLVLLSGGLRWNLITTENRGGFFGDRSTERSALAGQAAVTFGQGDGFTSVLQIARGFRDPTLSDRYFRGPSGRGFITGNPELSPEKSLQFDGSLRWNRGRHSAAFNVYSYEIDGLIERYRQGTDFFFRNRGDATIEGLELEGSTLLSPHLSMQVALSAGRGEADGSAVDDIAPAGGYLTLRWSVEKGYVFGRAGAFLRDDEPGPTEAERAGYFVADVGGGLHLTEKLEVRLLVNNILDRDYFESASELAVPATGRSVSAGLSGKF